MMSPRTHTCAIISSALIAGCLSLPPETERLGIERFLQEHRQATSPEKLRWGSEFPLPKDKDPSGHNWITWKAFALLANRKMLPAQFDTQELQKLVQYGDTFADQPWLGRPEDAGGTVINHMTASIDTYDVPDYEDPAGDHPQPRRRSGKVSTKRCAVPYYSILDSTEVSKVVKVEIDPTPLDLTYNIKLWAQLSTAWRKSCVGDEKPNVTPYLDAILQINGEEFGSLLPPTALDNLFHFAFRDVSKFGITDPRAFDLRLRISQADLFPKVGEGMSYDQKALRTLLWFVLSVNTLGIYDWDIQEKIAKKLADTVSGTRILETPEFGAVTYGAILFQLARKFFVGSREEPVLSELIGPAQTGQVRWEPPFIGPTLKLPATYLGGMPFVCAPPLGQSKPDKDSCLTGRRTWPIWVPETYSESKDFLTALLQERPGRSDRVAAIYLGWAAHMVQDGALPWHAANLQGIEHVVQETFAGLGYQPRLEAPIGMATFVRKSIADMTQVVVCENGEAGRVLTNRLPPSSIVDCPGAKFVKMDEYLYAEFERRFGNKSREQICQQAGIVDDQVILGRLNHEKLIPVFARPTQRAYSAVDKKPNALERVRDAVVSTMELILCAPPLGTPTSTPAPCTKGALQCFGNQAQLCGDGGWENARLCNPSNIDSYCRDGKCVSPQCSEGYRCDGNQPQVCSNEKWKPSAVCSTDGGECVDGKCVLRPDDKCPDGEFMCSGDRAKLCRDGRWVASQTCSNTGGHCANGVCVEPKCAEGSKRCYDSYFREVCNGGTWIHSKCEGGRRCVAPDGECQ